MIRGGRHSPAALFLSLVFGLFLLIPFVFTPVLAATTDTIAFQSKLVNSDGTNITNNTYNFRFRLYNASSGGTLLWSEDRSVAVADGVFSVDLGAVTAFSTVPTLFDNADLYLQICFDANGNTGDSADTNCDSVSHRYEEVFSTRKAITAVPLAFRAKALTDGAGNSFGPNSFFKQGGNAFGAIAVLGTTDTYGLQFKVNNAAAVTILSDGSVGIGTTGPDRKLDILDATNPQLRLTQADGAVYADFQVNSSGDLHFLTGGSSRVSIPSTGGLDVTDHLSVGPSVAPDSRMVIKLQNTAFSVNGSPVYGINSYVSNSGTGDVANLYAKVTDTTGSKMSVKGVYSDVTSSNSGTTYSYGGDFYSLSTGGAYSYGVNALAIANGSSGVAYGGMLAGQSNADASSSFGAYAKATTVGNSATVYGIYVETANSGTSPTEYGIYQDSTTADNYFAGNIGIGNSAPSQTLSIAGTLGIIEGGGTPTYYTVFQGGDQSATITYTLPTASANGVLTNSSGVLSWTTAGDITAVGSMVSGAAFADSTADDDWLGLGASAGRIEFDDQATDEVNILAASVGIGTSTPTSFTLQVAGHIGPNADNTYDLGSTALRFRDLYLGGNTLHIGTSLTDEATISYNSTSTPNVLNIGTDSTTNGDIAFFTNDLYLDKSAGFVGIGDATPSYTLDVTGDVNLTGSLGVGAGVPSATITVSGSQSYSGNNNINGISMVTTITNATLTTSNKAYYGVNSNLSSSLYSINGLTQSLTSLYGLADYEPASAGTASVVRGVLGSARVLTSTGTATTAYGVHGTVTASGGGTIDTAYGGFFDVVNSASTVTWSAGVYIDALSGSTSYGVYQEGTANENYFGGNVGIGRTNPAYMLDVLESGTGVIARFQSSNTTGCTLATGGTISCSSDQRLKKNVEDIKAGLEEVMALRPVTFDWKNQLNTADSLGFIAQEVQLVLPELITTDSETGFMQLNSIGLVPVLTRAIQEQQKEIEALRDRPIEIAGIGGDSYGISTETLVPGTLVSGVGKNGVYRNEAVHKILPAAEDSVKSYLGVIAEVVDEQKVATADNPYRITEAGTALVLIEEGDGSAIVYGDKIAISQTVPGYGVKDSLGTRVAIGWAIDSIDWTTVTETFAGKKFVRIGVKLDVTKPSTLLAEQVDSTNWLYSDATATLSTPAKVVAADITATIGGFNVLRSRTFSVNELLFVDDLGNLTTSGKISAAAVHTSAIKSVDGLVNVSLTGGDLFKVSTDGASILEASVQGVKVNNLVVTDQQAGRAVIKAGDMQATVKSTLVTSKSIVVVTPDEAVSVAVVPGAGEFVVKLSGAASEDVEVGWYVVNVE